MNIIRTEKDIETGLEALISLDPQLAPLLEFIRQNSGNIPLRRQKGGFEGLSHIIIGQHVSTTSAAAVKHRFRQHVAPTTPQNFLETPLETLIAIGLTRAKQNALRNLASAVLDGSLDLDAIPSLQAQDAISQLTQIKGIGPWTAEIYLLFCIGHPDIFAAGDLAIREAYRHAFDLEKRPEERELRQLATKWAPHRAMATRLFWSYYETVKGIGKGLPL